MLFTFRSKGEKRLLSSSSQEDEEQDKRRKVAGTGTYCGLESFKQGSGSAFWTSWIRIHNLIVRIRLRILP
jgi:hypothetical protein